MLLAYTRRALRLQIRCFRQPSLLIEDALLVSQKHTLLPEPGIFSTNSVTENTLSKEKTYPRFKKLKYIIKTSEVG